MSFIQVVDLSHWQGKRFDFVKAKAAGIRGVISKATQLGYGVDPDYVAVQQAVRKEGLLSGAYMFFLHGNVKAQCEFFLAHAYITDHTLVGIDHERARVGGPRPSIFELEEALHYLEDKLGRKAKPYSGNDIREELGRSVNPYLAQHDWWDASYTSHPLLTPTWKKVWLWQCSGDGAGPYGHFGTVPGIGTKLDVNHYFGSDEQLAAEWAAGPPAKAA